ncbi:MAG: SMC-Scp complex subunit ScpB [Sporomusaceae bacterium]|nr:SMC-Scp complex subunit ScpB [Sporomusaceae bacterium]
MFYQHLKGHVEALLFAAGDPVPVVKLAKLLEIDELTVRDLLDELRGDMEQEGRGLTLVEIAGGYQLCTKPELAPVIVKLAEIPDSRLSVAALETLSIIAFRQPVTKPEIEAIRGVKVDGVVNTLIERQLIREMGRKDVIGRPILYGTTEVFLQCFGLKDLSDLPDLTKLMPDEPVSLTET